MKKKHLLILLTAVLLLCGCGGTDTASGGIRHTADSESGQPETAENDGDSKESGDSGADAQTSGDPESSVGSNYQYYYTKLSDEEKEIYREIYQVIDEEKEGELSTTDANLAGEIQTYVLLDNPQFYYVSSCQYTTTSVAGKVIRMDYAPEIDMDEATRADADLKIEAFLNDFTIYEKDHPCEDDWDRALMAYEFILSQVDYVEDAPYNQTLYSAVCGETVCQGYSMSFKYLCDQMGIHSLIITGTSESGGSHAWNAVELDGEWCYVDCTYGDMECLKSSIDYSWFGVSDDQMFARTMEQSDLLPDCTSNANNYYYRQGEYKDSYSFDEFADLASSYQNFSVQFSNQEAYRQAVDDLFTEEHLKSLSGNRSCHFYYIEGDDSLCLHIQMEYD